MAADARPPAPPSRRNWVLVLLVLALAGGAYALTRDDGGPVGPRYRTQALEKRTVIRRVEASGHLAVSRRVEVPSLLSGQLLAVSPKVGDLVKAGDVLARIKPQPSALNAAVSTAQLAAARGNVDQAEAQARAAADALEQAKQLVAKGLMGEAELRQAQTKAQAANAALRAAKGQAAAAGATQVEAKRIALPTEIVSPIDGVVLTVPDEEGSLVGPSTGPIFVLADTLDRLILSAEVSELDVALLKAGQAADISVDAIDGDRFPGKVVAVGLIPARSGSLVTYPVTFELENPGQRLRPGLSATARVEADRAEGALAVPEAALRYAPANAPAGDDRSRVFRVGATGQPEAVAVRPGLSDGAFTVVLPAEGAPTLSVGEAIVIGAMKADEPAPSGGLNLTGKKP